MLISNRAPLQTLRPPVAPTPVSPRTETPLRKAVRAVEEEAADVVIGLSHFKPLADLGYKIYGFLTRPKADTPPLDNLGEVTPNLQRGAQPTEEGFARLKQQGVKTVINLRPEASWEAPMVEAQGMNYVYLPLPAVGAPTNEQAVQFLKTVTDPANGKVFFHCLHGADRTGAMAAAYRIAVQGWTADRAIDEMYQYHFHAGFEDAKLDFVRQFASYWQGLPPQQRAAILHASLDRTA